MRRNLFSFASICLFVLGAVTTIANLGWQEGRTQTQEDDSEHAARLLVGKGEGWVQLGQDDFVKVNCDDETWQWQEDGSVHCSGQPVGVIRSADSYTNFEMVAQWRHRKFAGNSGIFVWSPLESLEGLERGKLPHGIEVQVLDLGYKVNYEKSGKKADWFTCHGDVFPVGSSNMKPFEPISPNGRRSFPTKELTRGVDQWNDYYIRCINGEVRLWVNGEEVSGGNNCQPASGYIALESEGSPIEFRNLFVRVLP